jgi:hypothetical protein
MHKTGWATGNNITVFFVLICEGVYLYPMDAAKRLMGNVYYEKVFGEEGATYESRDPDPKKPLWAAIKTKDSAQAVPTLPRYPFGPRDDDVKEFANSNINNGNRKEYYELERPAKRARTAAAFFDRAA